MGQRETTENSSRQTLAHWDFTTAV